MKNYKAEKELNYQKRQLIRTQAKAVKAQILALEKTYDELHEQHQKLVKEAQAMTEQNEIDTLHFLD